MYCSSEDAFIYNETAGCGLFQSVLLDQTGLAKHCFSSRKGGVSPIPFDTLNLGLKRPDNRENVLENFRRVCRALDIDFESLIIANYTHGVRVEAVTSKDAGRGIHKEPLPECDGLVTNEKNLPIVTLHADCLPVFFLNPKHHAIGLCHAGWRGVYGKTAVNVLIKMNDCFDAQPQDCLIAVGPCIQECCFEVDEPVAKLFQEIYPQHVKKRNQKYSVNLTECLKKQMLDMGVLQQNISISKLCTKCHDDIFYSARAAKITGAMASVIALK